MASLKYHKDVKRWRVFWHVTLPDGTVDKGSKSFKGRPDGEKFKQKKEREEQVLKRAIFVQAPLLTDVLDEWKNYHPQLKSITIVGKGKKRRTIGLNNIAIDILEERRKGRKVRPDDHVFIRKDDEPLIRRSLNYYISKACDKAGIRPRGPHALRHFFATQLLLAGVPIIKVSILLGHASITTTQKHYSHILSPDLSDVTGVLEAI